MHSLSGPDGSERPKFGIGAEFRPKLWVSVSVSEPKFFLPKPKLFFFFFFQKISNFFMYFCFLKTWNWTQTFKSYLKMTETMRKPVTKLWLNQWLNQWPNQWQFWTEIPKTGTVFSRSSGFGIGYGIGRKYRPIRVSVSVSDRNQNSGFGRSLHQKDILKLTDLSSLHYSIFCGNNFE